MGNRGHFTGNMNHRGRGNNQMGNHFNHNHNQMGNRGQMGAPQQMGGGGGGQQPNSLFKTRLCKHFKRGKIKRPKLTLIISDGFCKHGTQC